MSKSADSTFSLRRDGLFLSVATLVGIVVGVLYIAYLDHAFFFQKHMPAAVAFACGHGLADPNVNFPELRSFLATDAREFVCASFPDRVEFSGLHYFEKWHIYFVLLVGLCWYVLGVSYAALWPLYGLIVASYATVSYAFFRLVSGRGLSMLGAVLVVTSPTSIYMLYFPRDYAKAGFILAVIWLLFLIARSTDARRTLMLAIACGFIMGLGLGFRADSLVPLPLALFTLLCFNSVARTSRWKSRLGSTLACLLAFGVTASPVLSTLVDGGPFGIVAVEGLTLPFTKFLKLEPSFFDPGQRYSDENSIAAVKVATMKPAAHRGEVATIDPARPWRDFPAARFYLSQLVAFPADTLTRFYASVLGIVNYHDTAGRYLFQHGGGDPAYFGPVRLDIKIINDVHSYFLRSLSIPSSYGVGILLLFLSIFYFSRYSSKEALLFVFVWLYMCAYPSIQFSMRHIFHFEPLFWFTFFASLQMVRVVLKEKRLPNWKPGVFIVVGGLTIAAMALAAARVYQAEAVHALVADRLSSARETLVVSRETVDGKVLWSMDPIRTRARIEGLRQPDWPAPDHPVRIRSARTILDAVDADIIVAEFGGDGCRVDLVAPTLRYRTMPDAWQRFDRDFVFPVPKNRAETIKLSFPAFYKVSQHFAGIELPAAEADCLVAVRRAVDRSSIQHPLYMVLPPRWRELTPYQTFLDFETPRRIADVM